MFDNSVTATMESILPVRGSPLLGEFSDAELEMLASSLQLVNIAKGETLFEQESAGDSLYIIVLGQVAVKRNFTEHNQKKQRTLAVVGPGECVGEMAIADGGPRSASVVTLEPIEALRLATETYYRLRNENPAFAVKLMLGLFRLLSKRLRQINNSMETAQLWLFSS